MTDTAPTKELRRLFEAGSVYADRWSASVRAALDVEDPLLPVVVASLEAGNSVVISGNAGDGKSHLAQRALDELSTRQCVEVTRHTPAPSQLPPNSLVFVKDASGLTDQQVLDASSMAVKAGNPLLITINEGPLASLAQAPNGEFFRRIRETIHRRAVGETPSDPPGCLILNLSGRQLTRAQFVTGALDRILPHVGPCGACGSSKSCPRVVGAKLLRKSKRARSRVEVVLRLLTDGGRHLSAREIWVFLIDIFFGWECPAQADEADRSAGFFWARIFDSESSISAEVKAQFDPLMIPMAREDVYIWLGRFADLDSEVEYPGGKPVVVAREIDEESAVEVFASAKRCYFFFAKKLDVERLLQRTSTAPEFGAMLQQAIDEPRPVVRSLTGLINRYRLGLDTESELWVSRHHGMAAHRRPAGIGAADKVSIDEVEVSVPFTYEANEYVGAGFFPTRVYLRWTGSNQLLDLDFATWSRLRESRTLTVDRDQEMLDFALDLFMSQAPVTPKDDPEVFVYDHRRGEDTTLRIRPEERSIEVLR